MRQKYDNCGSIRRQDAPELVAEESVQGEVIRITLRGVPIAKLVPAGLDEREDPRNVIRGIREIRKGVKLGKISIKELINEGRR